MKKFRNDIKYDKFQIHQIQIKEIYLFDNYLRELYKDLSLRIESNKEKGISIITFLNLYNLPLIIGEKLYKLFDKDRDGFLCCSEFFDGFSALIFGDYNEVIKLIFSLFDFKKRR